MAKTILDVIHETARGLHKADALDAQTMREFDALCLPPIKKYTANQIRKMRLNNKVSQAVFAAYLNTTPSTIRQWEQGIKHPSGMALRLLSLIDRNGLQILEA